MTRVAVVIAPPGQTWTGGGNYFENLLGALATTPDRRITTVGFVPAEADDAYLARFPTDEIVRTSAFARRAPLRLVGRGLEVAIGRNPVVELLARRHRIDLFSHVSPFGSRSPVRTMSWIPDFQEIHLPHLFPQDDIARRAADHATFVRDAVRVILSSEDARRDLLAIHPQAAAKARVLHFVSGVGKVAPTDAATLRDRYDLPDRFFHVPNQLWAHKNHGLILEALALLARRGIAATVIATGATEDYRDPGFASRFQERIAIMGLAPRFRLAGLVPFADVAGLLRHSVAVINPSLFEGWSTTVEEAKSLGKRVLLSDIAVHREQAPARGRFFATDDAAALADAMADTLAGYDPAEERRAAERAAADLPGRMQAFARAFEELALEAAGAR